MRMILFSLMVGLVACGRNDGPEIVDIDFAIFNDSSVGGEFLIDFPRTNVIQELQAGQQQPMSAGFRLDPFGVGTEVTTRVTGPLGEVYELVTVVEAAPRVLQVFFDPPNSFHRWADNSER